MKAAPTCGSNSGSHLRPKDGSSLRTDQTCETPSAYPRRSSLKERVLSRLPGLASWLLVLGMVVLGRVGSRRRGNARPRAAREAVGGLDADAVRCTLSSAPGSTSAVEVPGGLGLWSCPCPRPGPRPGQTPRELPVIPSPCKAWSGSTPTVGRGQSDGTTTPSQLGGHDLRDPRRPLPCGVHAASRRMWPSRSP
jgi:hypothetical protein